MTRLPPPFGSAIDRSTAIPYTFEGEALTGLAGDTIASALAANGRWVLSRSFKYHRPRGVQGHAMNEAAALVRVGSEPNVAADTRLLESGMEVRAQNVAGSLKRDRAAAIARIARFLPVGFYYRTFFRPGPAAWRKLWEPLVRRFAGLGVIGLDAPAAAFERRHLSVDVAVVGGGPAGLAAAIEAARHGAEVLLVDENPNPGGTLLFAPPSATTTAALSELCRAVREEPRIVLLSGARCTGWFRDNTLVVACEAELLKVRAGRTIFATGSYEQPLMFPGNDLPGIVFASTARRLMRCYAVVPGRRAAIVTASDDGYALADELTEAAVEIAAVLDLRAMEAPQEWRAVAITDARIRAAQGAKDNWHVASIAFSRGDSDAIERVACDLVCIGIVSLPAFHLPLQTGARLASNAAEGAAWIEGIPQGIRLAGAVASSGHELEAVVASGRAAGDPLSAGAAVAAPLAGSRLARLFASLRAVDGAAFVDLDEDVQVKDIRNALTDGFRDVELVKRFTTAGMGTSQGRYSSLTTAALVAGDAGEVQLTTVRPPAGPEELGRLAGPAFVAVARTPMDQEHVAAGAAMQIIGGWRRPAFYHETGSAAERISAEVALVRGGVGMLDVSTLGKIEVSGEDAGLFLDRLYTLSHATQPVGRVRYGLMLDELGSVMDDGVVARLSDDLFYVTTTTSGVAHVHRWMLAWRARWGLAVDILNVTAAWSAMNLAGPRAREVLASLEGDIDFTAAAFPWLNVRVGQLHSAPVRAMRIGFAGELAYELHAPRALARHLWRAILAAGAAQGLRPYGVEASRILRLEKGHIIVGQDSDAMSTPAELGFDWAVSPRKRFFIGKRSLQIPSRATPARRLIGFTAPAGAPNIEEGLAILDAGSPVGWVTSAAISPTLGCWIGLAIVPTSLCVASGPLVVRTAAGGALEVTRTPLPFYDPANKRQDM